MDAYALFTDKFLVYFLVLVRMSSLFVITPVFGGKNLPSYLKIGFAVFCTFILTPLLGNVQIQYINLYGYAAIVAKEFMIGIIMGFVSYLVFTALYVAGQIIDIQLGFGMVNLIDPIQDIQVPLTGNFIYILVTLFFLIIDGHHVLLTALFNSYKILPIDSFVFTDLVMNNILKIFCEVFVIAFKISIPVLAASLLAEISLGILSRTVPQMNVFVVGMPFKIGVGLITLYFMMPFFIKLQNATFDKMYSYIFMIIKSMAKG